MENRNGLLVDLKISQARGTAEREAAEEMIRRQRRKGVRVKSLGADKNYDTHGFVNFLRGPPRSCSPHLRSPSCAKRHSHRLSSASLIALSSSLWLIFLISINLTLHSF